jgi:Winged helix-turn helix
VAHIVEHLPVEELERRYRAARDATEARHIQAIWLLAQGRTVLDVASVLAFVPRGVEELAARYNAHGPDALGDQRRRNGRAASVLTPALLAALSERLRAPPEDGGRWTGPKVAVWMARHLGVERVHPQRGWAEAPKVSPARRAGGRAPEGALKRVRWSLQAPRPRHPRSATPEQRAAFKGGSRRRPPRPGPRTPTGRSRPGPRTSTASA